MALSRPYRAQPQTLHYPRALPWAVISRPFRAEENLQVSEDCVQALRDFFSEQSCVFLHKTPELARRLFILLTRPQQLLAQPQQLLTQSQQLLAQPQQLLVQPQKMLARPQQLLHPLDNPLIINNKR
jgi:hypothetical protein